MKLWALSASYSTWLMKEDFPSSQINTWNNWFPYLERWHARQHVFEICTYSAPSPFFLCSGDFNCLEICTFLHCLISCVVSGQVQHLTELNRPHTAGVCVCVFVSFFLLLSSLKLPLGLMKSQVKKRVTALLKVFLNSHGCTCFVFACLHVCVLSDRFSVLCVCIMEQSLSLKSGKMLWSCECDFFTSYK